jgi:hypothetical protein
MIVSSLVISFTTRTFGLHALDPPYVVAPVPGRFGLDNGRSLGFAGPPFRKDTTDFFEGQSLAVERV